MEGSGTKSVYAKGTCYLIVVHCDLTNAISRRLTSNRNIQNGATPYLHFFGTWCDFGFLEMLDKVYKYILGLNISSFS